jgi:hypothetical protein
LQCTRSVLRAGAIRRRFQGSCPRAPEQREANQRQSATGRAARGSPPSRRAVAFSRAPSREPRTESWLRNKCLNPILCTSDGQTFLNLWSPFTRVEASRPTEQAKANWWAAKTRPSLRNRWHELLDGLPGVSVRPEDLSVSGATIGEHRSVQRQHPVVGAASVHGGCDVSGKGSKAVDCGEPCRFSDCEILARIFGTLRRITIRVTRWLFDNWSRDTAFGCEAERAERRESCFFRLQLLVAETRSF